MLHSGRVYTKPNIPVPIGLKTQVLNLVINQSKKKLDNVNNWTQLLFICVYFAHVFQTAPTCTGFSKQKLEQATKVWLLQGEGKSLSRIHTTSILREQRKQAVHVKKSNFAVHWGHIKQALLECLHVNGTFRIGQQIKFNPNVKQINVTDTLAAKVIISTGTGLWK